MYFTTLLNVVYIFLLENKEPISVLCEKLELFFPELITEIYIILWIREAKIFKYAVVVKIKTYASTLVSSAMMSMNT